MTLFETSAYGVVVFSILVQGLTLPTLLRKALPLEDSAG